MNSIGGKAVSVTIAPTISAGTFAGGKQVGGVNQLPQVAISQGQITNLTSIVVTDKSTSAGSVSYNVWFFNRSVTLSSSSGNTLVISATNAAYVVGKINVADCFFSKPGNTSGFAIAALNMPATAMPMVCQSPLKSLYCVVEVNPNSSTSAVFAANGDITLTMTFSQGF